MKFIPEKYREIVILTSWLASVVFIGNGQLLFGALSFGVLTYAIFTNQ